MKIEIDITADEAKAIVEHFESIEEHSEADKFLFKILSETYENVVQKENEIESFKDVTENFIIHCMYGDVPENYPELFNEEIGDLCESKDTVASA